MRKRRSNRRLSASPAEHSSRAERGMMAAAAYARESKAATKQERCGLALEKLILAENALAVAKRDVEDSGDFPALDEATALPMRSAEMTFRNQCLIGGGLSGLRRRR